MKLQKQPTKKDLWQDYIEINKNSYEEVFKKVVESALGFYRFR